MHEGELVLYAEEFSTTTIEEPLEGDYLLFYLHEEKLVDLTYYLKVSAQGGGVLQMDGLTFKTECGDASARILEPEGMEETYHYTIDGNLPTLELEAYASESAICSIKLYEVYQSQDAEETHPKFLPIAMPEAGKLKL